MMKRITSILFLHVRAAICSADAVLPKVIAAKMILQRGVEAPVWG